MNKAQLADMIAEQTGLTKVCAQKSLNAMIDVMSQALSQGEKITLTGLGTFSVTKTKERIGRNMRTGAPMKIAPKNVVKFRPGTELSSQVKD